MTSYCRLVAEAAIAHMTWNLEVGDGEEDRLTPTCQSSSGFICSIISYEKSRRLIKVMCLGSVSGIYKL